MFGRKLKRKILNFAYKRNAKVNGIHPRRKVLKAGLREVKIFKCGEHVVVYEYHKVIYNSVIDKQPYDKWLIQFKEENQ